MRTICRPKEWKLRIPHRESENLQHLARLPLEPSLIRYGPHVLQLHVLLAVSTICALNFRIRKLVR